MEGGEKTNAYKNQPQDFKKTYMSDRTIFDYMENLEIPESEIAKEGLILDIGAGAQQKLAHEAGVLGMKSKIYSLDPRLGLDEEKDLSLPRGTVEERKMGRKEHHGLSVAGTAQKLPFLNEAFDNIYALFSVPYYIEAPEEIRSTLSEIWRVTRAGGTIRFYPILKEQVAVVENYFKNLSDAQYTMKLKSTDPDGGEDWLAVIKKIRRF
jgi:ubiquinone/menaquinone biosynthesis C-methylase UbiE